MEIICVQWNFVKKRKSCWVFQVANGRNIEKEEKRATMCYYCPSDGVICEALFFKAKHNFKWAIFLLASASWHKKAVFRTPNLYHPTTLSPQQSFWSLIFAIQIWNAFFGLSLTTTAPSILHHCNIGIIAILKHIGCAW